MKDFFKNFFNFKESSREGNIVKIAIIFLVCMFLIIAKCACETVAECMEQKALRYTGIREATGNNDGAFVDNALRNCDLQGTNAAWCGGILFTVHLECGVDEQSLPTSPCYAPSWGRVDKIVWRNGEAPDAIQKGMDVCLWSESKGRIGHVGWVVYKDRDGRGWYVVYCSGNTRDPGNNIQPGEGVHMVKLYLSTIHAIADWTSSPTRRLTKYHVVRPKENLYRLSIMYAVSTDDLRRWNNISDNGIWIGQELKVSE